MYNNNGESILCAICTLCRLEESKIERDNLKAETSDGVGNIRVRSGPFGKKRVSKASDLGRTFPIIANLERLRGNFELIFEMIEFLIEE